MLPYIESKERGPRILASPLPVSIAPGSWMFLVVSRAVVLSPVLEALDLSANIY